MITGHKSYYYLSGMYAKECIKYHGPTIPKMELPNWMKATQKSKKNI